MRSSLRLTLLLLTLLPLTASASTYYVDDSGSDSNPGTITQPFRHVQHAIDQIDSPGDVVYIRAGTYAEEVLIWDKHGTSSDPIWVLNYNSEPVVITGAGVTQTHSLFAINESSYVTVMGLEVTNSSGTGINIWDADHINVEWCVVHNVQDAGIHAGTDVIGATHDVVIRGNEVYDAVRSNAARTATSGWMQAISCYQADNVEMTENWVYENYGEGIDCIVSDHCTITKNNIWDNFGGNIYLDNAQYALVDGNFIYNSGNSDYFRGGHPSNGIQAANEYYDTQNPLTDLTITNNIVLWCQTGFTYWDSQYGGGLHYTLMANNTFYESDSSMRLLYIEDGNHDTTTVSNNIFKQQSGVGYAWAATSGITYRTNCWYGGTANTQVSGSGDVLSNPQFVLAGGWDADDYKLTSTSPCKTAGTTESAVTTDYWGTARTTSYSIGAHEY